MKDDLSILAGALSLIASPMRPDGTWNRDRQACQILAEEALRKIGFMPNSQTKEKETSQKVR